MPVINQISTRHIVTGFLILLSYLLGMWRDHLFISTNNSIYYAMETPASDPLTAVSLAFTLTALMGLKWFMTFAFTAAFLSISGLSVYILFRNKKLIYWVIYVFTAVMGVAFVFYTAGHLVGYPDEGYQLARRFMGFAQSPVLLLILIPAFSLLKK